MQELIAQHRNGTVIRYNGERMELTAHAFDLADLQASVMAHFEGWKRTRAEIGDTHEERYDQDAGRMFWAPKDAPAETPTQGE